MKHFKSELPVLSDSCMDLFVHTDIKIDDLQDLILFPTADTQFMSKGMNVIEPSLAVSPRSHDLSIAAIVIDLCYMNSSNPLFQSSSACEHVVEVKRF